MATVEFRAAASEAQAQQDDAAEEPIDFVIKDKSGTVSESFQYFKPTGAQIAIYISDFNTSRDLAEKLSVTFRLLSDMMPEEDYHDLMEMVRNRSHWIDINDLPGMLETMFEGAAARPTPRSTGSTASRRSGGPRLMDHLPPQASTRSRSTRAASATSSKPSSSAT